MKKFISLLSLAVVMLSCRNNGTDRVSIESLDSQTLFPTLFNAADSSGWCTWKPGAREINDTLILSADGRCHTHLDTVFTYTDGASLNAVIILGTYNFTALGIDDCHACAVTVSIAVARKEESGRWNILHFVKNFGLHGSWGHLPGFRIARFGKQYFLEEEGGSTGQGVTESWNTFWHLPMLVTALETQGMDDSGYFEDESRQTVWEDRITDISEGNVTKVKVTREGVEYDPGKGQQKLNKKTEYRMDDSGVFRPLSSLK
jgi:hypothetical protein